MTYEELETLTNGMRERLGEENSATISEDLLNVLSSYKASLEKIAELTSENEKLKCVSFYFISCKDIIN